MADEFWIQSIGIFKASEEGGPSTLEKEVVWLFAELRPPLLRYLRGLGLAAGDAEDVTQDAFIELFRHLREGKPRDNLRAWIYRVARNLAWKRRQRDSGWGNLELDGNVAQDQASNPEQLALLTERERLVQAVVAALAPLDRQCLQLRAEGLRYREIASILDISLGSVAASLSRSLSKIARATRAEK